MSIKRKLYVSHLFLLILPVVLIVAFARVWIDSIGYTRLGLYLLAAAIIFMVAANFLLTYLLAKSILQPIEILKKAAYEIKRGNLDFDLAYQAADEFGDMIREFDEMRHKLKESLEQNLQYEQERKELTANIVHDLKSPIMSIRGHIEGILDGVADSRSRMESYLHTIYEKTGQIDKLVNDLFLISKLDLHQLPLHLVETDMVSYVAEVYDELSREPGADVRYRLEQGCGQPVRVLLDPGEMRRVIGNIVQNSVKYKADRPLEIIFTIRENENNVILKITDNGIGVDIDNEKKIFRRFYRVDSARKSGDGSGLGLSIAKQLVEAAGGRIWARKNPEQGMSVYISLPIYSENTRV